MKNWQEQALLNNLELTKGDCQLCGGQYKDGIKECVSIFEKMIHYLDHDDGIKHMTIFLSVDAHALSHAEIHGRWNNHFHLCRMHLILTHKIKWTYQLSPLLSQVINAYKAVHKDEIIITPPYQKRGTNTLADFQSTFTKEAYLIFVNNWSTAVYDVFSTSHSLIDIIAEIFLKKFSHIVYKK